MTVSCGSISFSTLGSVYVRVIFLLDGWSVSEGLRGWSFMGISPSVTHRRMGNEDSRGK